jgi:hypothetical protein
VAGHITDYLFSLARQLRLDPDQEREIIREVEAHLEDKADEFESQGMTREAALELAVRYMGAPKTVAGRMYAVHSPGVWRDVLLATMPHFLLASLFALHLWSHYFLVGLLLIGVTLVTWRNWRAGHPSKWSYSWLGYTLAAPILSWLLALITLSYGGWTLMTTGQLPFNVVLFFLLIGYVPFSMWVLANVISKVMQRDWLLASFTALPFPFLTSWVLFLNWQGGLWGTHAERIQDSDTARAFIFLALAITTAVFLKIGPRLLKIGLLTVTTAILVAVTVTALPVDFNLLALLLIILASVVFLLSPAMLESQLGRRYSRRPAYQPGEEEDIASPPVP